MSVDQNCHKNIAGEKAEARRALFFGLLVAAIAFLVYANSLGNGFVMDDYTVIVSNPLLRDSPGALFNYIDSTRENETLPYYRPLTILTFLLEERLHGLAPFPMHLVNVLLHAATAFLVYLMALTVLGKDARTAFLAGVLFAVHPINTEVVDFISARNGLLCCLFMLIAYLVHHRSVLRKNIWGGVLAAVFLSASLFSKETALMAFPFIVALEFSSLRAGESGLRTQAVLRLLPYAAVLIFYMIVRWKVLSQFGIQTSIIPGMGAEKLQSVYEIPNLAARLMLNVYLIPRYILAFVWPIALSPRYAIPSDFNPLIPALTAVWFCIVFAVGWLLTRGRSKTTIFGLAWFALFYLPVSGVAMFPSSPMADRFMYIPAIGLWIIASDQINKVLVGNPAFGTYALSAVALVTLVLGGITVRRNMDWKDEVRLMTRFVEQYPEDAYSHLGLGNAYFAERDRRERYLDFAELEYTKALGLNPVLPGVYTNMGYIALARGDSEIAVHYYTRALSIYPLDKEALLNRGIAHENLGKQKEARQDFLRFLAIKGYELADARPYAEARVRALSK